MDHQGTSATLTVDRWGALLSDIGTPLGGAKEADAIPLAMRRRMPEFMSKAVRCALGVMEADTALVFASRYGDLTTTVAMLEELAGDALLSPTAFSNSVHNAGAGMASQIRGFNGSHTAIAGGANTLSAGLIDAYVRLVAGESSRIAFVFGDSPIPPTYGCPEAEDDGVFVGLQLSLKTESQEPAFSVRPGATKARELVRALTEGCRSICLPEFA